MASCHQAQSDDRQELEAQKLAEFDTLRMHTRTGQSIHISGTGHNKVFGYRTGVVTELGDLEISDWMERMMILIAKYEESALYEQLLLWLKEHNYCRETPKELQLKALELHAHRIFDDPGWCDYIPWNNRFRPEAIKKTQLIWAVTDCCKKPGLTTEAQIKQAYQGKLCCPHCGRYSTFSRCAEQEKE